MSESSYRASLRSSSIVGGAQLFTVFSSLVKMKMVAVVLGPAGVGLVGLYMNLMSTAASISALGIGTTGIRQIVNADIAGGEVAVGKTRRALFWGSLALALLGMLGFWLSRDWIARVILSDQSLSGDVAWVAIGVGLSVIAASQTALLTGLRRIGDLAKINIGAGVMGAVFGVVALWLWPAHGLLVVVLSAPVLTFLLGRLYIVRLGPVPKPRARISVLVREWREMAGLGVAFMVSGVVLLLGQLAIRTLVQRELGADALGQFQAAWSISVTYLGFVLGAMATDYLPRLTAVIRDRGATVKLINEQTEVALLLCAPIVLAMIALSPWLIRLLYSAEFGPAVDILRWQLLGDVLKVISWPLGFMQQARGAGKTFLLTETFASSLLAVGVLFGLPYFGLSATGIAFLGTYLIYLPLMWWLGRKWFGFRWARSVRTQAIGVFALAVLVDIACRSSELFGAAIGGVIALLLGVWAVIRLSSLAGLDGRLGRIGALGATVAARLKRRH